MTSVITTSITGVKSCKYQYFTERASRVLFGHNQPRSAGVIRSIKTLHIELSYRVISLYLKSNKASHIKYLHKGPLTRHDGKAESAQWRGFVQV